MFNLLWHMVNYDIWFIWLRSEFLQQKDIKKLANNPLSVRDHPFSTYAVVEEGELYKCVRLRTWGRGGGICSYVRKKKNSTATKTKKQPNDTGIICVTNSTRKICKIPARKNLPKFRNMTLERRSIEYNDRRTFNQTFNVIFLTLSRFFRLRVWFLKTVFSRIIGSFYFSYVRNIPSLPLLLFCNAFKCNRTYSPCPILIITKPILAGINFRQFV